MSRILITGGCGFIGHHLAKACLSNNDDVTVLDNLFNGKRDRIPKNIKYFEGDVRDTRLLKKIIKDKEIVFHLAAVTSLPRTMTEWTLSNSVNLGGTVNVFDVASQLSDPPVVIYASSAAVYGNSSLKNTERGEVQPINPYGLDKLSCERQAAMFSRIMGLKTIGLRFFNVYGSGQKKINQYAGVINIFLRNIREGKDIQIFGDGKQTRDFIYVIDVIKILLAIKRNPNASAPITNIATGKSVSILKLAEIMKKITQSDIKTKFKKERSGDIYRSIADVTLLKQTFPELNTIGLNKGLKMLIDEAKNN